MCEYLCEPISIESDDIMSRLKLQHFQTYSYTTLLVPFNNKPRNAWKLGLNHS